jgi:hypothetical protein
MFLGFVVFSAQALSQRAISEPATRGAVTFDELEGFIVEANVVRDQVTERGGRRILQQAHNSDWPKSFDSINC